MHSILQDVRYALRAFRSGRSGLLLTAVVLAVAIGAVSITYSVVSGVLLKSLPYSAPERLVNVRVAPLSIRVDDTRGATMSPEVVELLLAPTGAFESAAYLRGAGQPVLTGLGDPERIEGWKVGPGFFEVLGSRPMLGRALTAADASEGGVTPVVVSHRFWRSRLGGAPDAVGRTLTLDGSAHQVVGVMPPGFEFPEEGELWMPAPPLSSAPGSGQIQGRYWLVGRLAPGLTPLQARDRLDARFQSYAAEFPGFATWGPNLASVHEMITGTVRKPLLLLLGAVGLVLLLACANVAAVLLARGIARRRELSIRLAIGASHRRLVRQLLTESVLLALLSGAGGVALAYSAVPALVSLAGAQLPRAAEIAVDWRVLLITLAISTFTGLLAGLLPAALAAREEVARGGAEADSGSWRIRMGEGLVVIQVALGTLLLAGAGLLGASFVKLTGVDYGFEPSRAVVAEVVLSSDRYGSAEQRRAFAEGVLERAAGLPGVEAAAVSSGIPFDGGAIGSVGVPGSEVPEGAPAVWFTSATPDYFRVLGMGLLRGRPLPGGAGEVVVNEALARAYFPGQDPIGRTITYYGDVQGRIVGVVSDVRQSSLEEPAPPQLYAPFASDDVQYLKIVVRARGNPAATGAALREAVRSMDPVLPVDRIGVLTDWVGESVARQRFYAVALAGFALIALVITALGMYGLAAYSVSRRTREIGIRRALGASARHIGAVTVGRTALLAGAGLVLGLLGALATTRVLEALLFGLTPTDPFVFGGVALLLAAVTVAAAYPAARRATRVDPMVVLRTE